MVAYSFHRIFAPAVESYEKLQTCRALRHRHARPGERLQLYTGMRTRACRKLVDPDPVCTMVHDIRFDIPPGRLVEEMSIEIDGMELVGAAAGLFAVDDGFGAVTAKDELGQVCGPLGLGTGRIVSPLKLMTAWWIDVHGPGIWRGVCVKWRPADGAAA